MPQWADLPVAALALVLAELAGYLEDHARFQGSMLFTTIPLACRNWRNAALSATGGITLSVGTQKQLEALALWLQNHGHLLKELSITADSMSGGRARRPKPSAPLMPGAAGVLASALEAAATKAAGSSNTHQPQLQLQTFRCNLPDAAALTRFFSPSTLTSLELMGIRSYTAACPPGPAITSALAQLPQLRSLNLAACSSHNIGTETASAPVRSQCITTASRLTSLTRLILMDAPANSPLHHLPTSLQDLVVDIVPPQFSSRRWLGWAGAAAAAAEVEAEVAAMLPPFSISHLAQLRSLSCFTVHGGKQLQQLSSLQQLTSLSLHWAQEGPNRVLHPSQAYQDYNYADAACWVGPKRQRLKELRVMFCPDGDAVVHALSKSLASSLTSLDLTLCNLSDDAVPLLVTLTALKSLELADNGDITELPADFANLTGLTQLSLGGTYVDDDSLVLLQKLQQLEWLALDECPCSKEALQVLKDQLPRLVELSHECFEDDENELEGLEGVEDVGMMMHALLGQSRSI